MVAEARQATYSFAFGGGAFGGLALLTWTFGAALLSCLLGLRWMGRASWLPALLSGLVAFGLSGYGLRLAASTRREVWQAYANRTMPLIAEIRAYERRHGRPPNSLEDVGLEGPPAPGAYALRLVVPGSPPDPSDERWRLVVDAGSPPGSFGDRFVYQPSGNYPEKGYGGILERMGAWGYYHE
ncbi:MAG: hypothetical protein KIS66_08870 [Fimbriimonadaceae bacterium]|nr:hypothetical protein [Fimbriimonadaceae bacterium]